MMSGNSASAVKCPACGAPAVDGATRCDYCHSVLATISCPVCFGLLLQGAAFCPHCGAARSRAEIADRQTTPCPSCRGTMHWLTVGTTELLECEKCDGTWVEAATFERLCADRESQAGILKRPEQPPRKAGKSPSAEPIRYRPCPRCGKLMNRMNFAHVSGTVVDVCRGHGTFLDRGELHQVVQFILDGGIDRARQHERDDLLEQQRRLLELQRGETAGAQSQTGWTAGVLQQFLGAITGKD